MKKIRIGGSNFSASAIAMGCMRITEKTPQEVCALIEAAADSGIDVFDHADIYGQGAAEEVFAQGLKLSSVRREDIIIQSKCGIRQGFFDFSKDYIVESTEKILKRLNAEYLDILLLHRPDTLLEPDEIAEAFDILNSSGKVKSFGVSNMNAMQLEYLGSRITQKILVNQLQFSAAHTGIIDAGLNVNMKNDAGIDRDGSVMEYCRMKDITIQTWSSLQYGFFEGTFLNSEIYPELNNVLDHMAEEKGITPGAVAIAWILRHPASMQAVVGTTSVNRLKEMARAADVSMSREEWYEIYKAAGNILP